MAPIAVIADNQEHLVSLPDTLHDVTLAKSIISKHKAFATQGRIKTTNPISIVTSTGDCFASSSTVTLRWRYDAGMQSFQETFWIVDGCAGYDAILRKGIESLEDADGDATPQAFPLQFGSAGKKGEKLRQERDKVKQERDQQYQKERQSQEARMKKQMEVMKGPRARS